MKIKQYLFFILTTLFITLSLSSVASALLAISFQTNSFIPKGAVVTQTNSNSQIVQLANNSSPYGFLGVVTQSGSRVVLVTQSGVVGMLVSNINGNINAGSTS